MTPVFRYGHARARLLVAWRNRALSLKAIAFGLVGVVNTAVDYCVFLLARAAFDSSAATLAAYAVGLIPFVTIRSAVATFYARKDTATPVKASLTGLTVNVLLKVLLMGSLAQIGLALATAVGAWINLLLVLGFAVRAGYLDLDKALMRSLVKFVVCGVVLSAAFWLAARFAAIEFAQMKTFRDEITLVWLIAVGAFVYGVTVLLLFGRGWIFSLVRDRQAPRQAL